VKLTIHLNLVTRSRKRGPLLIEVLPNTSSWRSIAMRASLSLQSEMLEASLSLESEILEAKLNLKCEVLRALLSYKQANPVING
jgi:hypothetical protein